MQEQYTLSSPHPPEWRDIPSRATSIRVATLLLAIAIVLGFVVRGERSLAADLALLDAIQGVELTGLDTATAIMNAIGSTVGALAITAMLIVAGVLLRRPRFSAQVLLVLALRLIGEILKPSFQSPRPGYDFLRDPDRTLTTFGYPSGHAFTFACVSGLLVVLAVTLESSRRMRWATVAVGVMLILGGAFSRVWVGLHWPFDTLGGALFGVSAVLIALAILPIRAPAAPG